MPICAPARGLCTAALALGLASTAAAAPEADTRWLNDSDAPRALKWVEDEDRKTLAALGKGALFATLKDEAAAILTAPDRIPEAEVIDDQAYNYWQDRDHPLGLWRRSPAEAYFSGTPRWETVIDLDALSAKDGHKWFFAGAKCRAGRCLVRLSDNGQDAGEVREFDLAAKTFVPGGFVIPLSKSNAAWYDDDTLIVTPTFGDASVNESGQARTVRLWTRGTPFAASRLLLETKLAGGTANAQPVKADGVDGFIGAIGRDFFRRDYMFLAADGARTPLSLPAEMESYGVHDGRLVLRLNQDWRPDGGAFTSGSVVAVPLKPLIGGDLSGVTLMYKPAANEGVEKVVAMNGRFYVQMLRDYRSAIVELAPAGSGWAARTLPLPADHYTEILSPWRGQLYLRTQSMLEPRRLVLADPAGRLRPLYAEAPQFNAATMTTEILETKSRDGTPIAYTIMHRKDMKPDGSNPTLVYGYGGYIVSVTPRYEPLFGKLWVERGGVYVHAYLRGGGEKGPEWHKATMLKNRQRPFDDMTAVLQDLQRRNITTPEHTGIMGRSNGGLLVTGMMTQHPELMNALVAGGPLTDMLTFHELPPGASWVAEFGDPRDPDMHRFLASYSPLQRLTAGAHYPVPLVITATDDDRVLPGHARRFAARMEALGHRHYYFEDRQGGHYWELGGGPIPGDWRLRSIARAVEYSYLWQQLR